MRIFGENWTKEQFAEWLNKHDDPPSCNGCGAMAGVCKAYPNCPGNPEYKGKQDDK